MSVTKYDPNEDGCFDNFLLNVRNNYESQLSAKEAELNAAIDAYDRDIAKKDAEIEQAHAYCATMAIKLDKKDAEVAELNKDLLQWKESARAEADAWDEAEKEIAELKKRLLVYSNHFDGAIKELDEIADKKSKNKDARIAALEKENAELKSNASSDEKCYDDPNVPGQDRRIMEMIGMHQENFNLKKENSRLREALESVLDSFGALSNESELHSMCGAKVARLVDEALRPSGKADMKNVVEVMRELFKDEKAERCEHKNTWFDREITADENGDEGMHTRCADCGKILNEKAEVCEWEEDENGDWETDCHHIFTFTDYGVTENEFQYCTFCGRRIKEIRYEEKADGGEGEV